MLWQCVWVVVLEWRGVSGGIKSVIQLWVSSSWHNYNYYRHQDRCRTPSIPRTSHSNVGWQLPPVNSAIRQRSIMIQHWNGIRITQLITSFVSMVTQEDTESSSVLLDVSWECFSLDCFHSRMESIWRRDSILGIIGKRVFKMFVGMYLCR